MKILKELDEDQLAEIEQLPRAERFGQLANLRNAETKDLVKEAAKELGLPLVDKIDLVENPTATLPLRLIHEYQCVPVRGTHSEEAAPDEPDTPEADSPVDADAPRQETGRSTSLPSGHPMTRWTAGSLQ